MAPSYFNMDREGLAARVAECDRLRESLVSFDPDFDDTAVSKAIGDFNRSSEAFVELEESERVDGLGRLRTVAMRVEQELRLLRHQN